MSNPFKYGSKEAKEFDKTLKTMMSKVNRGKSPQEASRQAYAATLAMMKRKYPDKFTYDEDCKSLVLKINKALSENLSKHIERYKQLKLNL